MTEIHPTAVVAEDAIIGEGCKIGPFCIIASDVKLGRNVRLDSHVNVGPHTSLGDDVRVFPFACVGMDPEDLKYGGETSRLEVGDRTVIREKATLHRGTSGGGMLTRVGADCFLMVGTHVAHDCQLGDHVILVNSSILGGHVEIEDYAIVGGNSAVHQFVQIGAHAMIGGGSVVVADIIPFGMATGNRASLEGLNITGLKRRGFSREDIHALRGAFKSLFRDEGEFSERLARTTKDYSNSAVVQRVISFIEKDTSRALCQPKADRAG